jgi:hypothetical protein
MKLNELEKEQIAKEYVETGKRIWDEATDLSVARLDGRFLCLLSAEYYNDIVIPTEIQRKINNLEEERPDIMEEQGRGHLAIPANIKGYAAEVATANFLKVPYDIETFLNKTNKGFDYIYNGLRVDCKNKIGYYHDYNNICASKKPGDCDVYVFCKLIGKLGINLVFEFTGLISSVEAITKENYKNNKEGYIIEKSIQKQFKHLEKYKTN